MELHPAVIALEHDRARALLIGVQSPARYPRHLTVVDDLDAVENHRHAVGNQGYFIGLPFTRRLVGIDGGDDEPVKSSLAVNIQRPAVAIEDLDLL